MNATEALYDKSVPTLLQRGETEVHGMTPGNTGLRLCCHPDLASPPRGQEGPVALWASYSLSPELRSCRPRLPCPFLGLAPR